MIGTLIGLIFLCIVLGVVLGAVCYQRDPLLSLAIRDESSLVLPYPG